MKTLRTIQPPHEKTVAAIFVRSNGKFGFDEYREEPENPMGWQALVR